METAVDKATKAVMKPEMLQNNIRVQTNQFWLHNQVDTASLNPCKGDWNASLR